MAARSKNTTTIIVAASVAVLLALVVAAVMYNSEEIDWSKHYRHSKTGAYSTSIVYDLLESKYEDNLIEVIDSLHLDMPEDPTGEIDNYIIIGAQSYCDSSDMKRLISFVEKGNRAFLFLEDLDNYFLDSLLMMDESEEDLPYFDLSDDNDNYYYYNVNEDAPYYVRADSDLVMQMKRPKFLPQDTILVSSYSYFSKESLYFSYLKSNTVSADTSAIKVQGTVNDGHINFAKFNYKDGEIYVLTTPLVLGNLYQIKKEPNQYARDLFKHLGPGKVYWDSENLDYDYKLNQYDDDDSLNQEGPLEFILSEKTLRRGWYILLIATLLYLIFGARRKQRVIPVIENMENTSIEYAEVISQMFMKQSNHSQLIRLKMDHFKFFLRERYALRLPTTQEEENDNFYHFVAQRSGIAFDDIKKIFEDYKYLSAIVEVDTPSMLNLHHRIESFYKRCR